MLVKVGKHKGAEKADDLQSVARTTDPTYPKREGINTYRATPKKILACFTSLKRKAIFDLLVLTNIIGDDGGNTPDKRKANWILAAFIVGKFPCGDNVMQPTHVPSRGAKCQRTLYFIII